MFSRFLILALLASCVPSQQEEVTSGGQAGNPDAPARWPLGSFPKTLEYANSFNATQIAEFTKSAHVWSEDAGDYKVVSGVKSGTEFFKFPSGTVSNRGNTNDLDSLLDRKFGVYKTTNWSSHRELGSGALAVTQIFGVRQNLGKANEYVEIIDADILINYQSFDFSYPGYAGSSKGSYDLFTVMIHEFGHFLGLNHVESYSLDTVMFPYIGESDFYFEPGNYDISMIQDKYELSSGGGASGMSARRAPASVKEAETHPDEVFGSDRGVRIMMELYPNGKCIHKINGTPVESHFVDLNKKK